MPIRTGEWNLLKAAGADADAWQRTRGDHPARLHARDYKKAFAVRLTETARQAGATNPEQLGEQLALLLDGASARNRVLNTETFTAAAAITTVLVNNAIPTASELSRA